MCDGVKLVEMIWLGEQIAKTGRQQLQDYVPGIPIAELVVMADLVDHAPSTITDITQRTGYAQSRVSAAVASMVEREWVWTEADPADGRRTVVVISEQARTDAKALQKEAEDRLMAALLDGTAPEQQTELAKALEELLIILRKRT
jgi:DNA-binding MarR family transcriptional regulator